MAVKAKYTKEDEVPETLRKDYKKVGDVWLLQVEGGRPDGFVEADEFDRVKTESETRKGKLAKFKDIDPDKVAADFSELETLRKGAGNEQVRIDAATARLTTEGQTKDTRIKTLEEQLSTALLDNTIRDIALKAGARPDALKFIVDDSKKTFIVNKDGQLEARDSVKGKDGKPLQPAEWMGDVKTASAFLFQGSSGGGAGDAASKVAGGDASKANPFKAGPTFNLFQQGVMQKENPEQAARMKAEATGATT